MQERKGLPVQLPSAFAAFQSPLTEPARGLTHDPRFFWDPARLHLHSHIAAGLPVSTASELSLLQRSVDLHAAAYRAQQAQYEQLYPSPTSSLRGLSPVGSTRGLSTHEYLATMSALGQRSLADYPGAASLVGSDYSLNLEGSRLSLSPRHGRKRPLSSAFSDSFDLGSMIRFSPNSLVPLPVMNGSRCSSASGSYGHLSAGTAGAISPALGMHPGMPASHLQQLQAHLMSRGSPYLAAQAHSAGLLPAAAAAAAAAAVAHGQHPLFGMPPYTGLTLDRKEEQPKVSPDTSTLESAARGGISVKREVSSTSGATPERADDEPPEDFIVTHCDWEDCGRDYDLQADLVKHVNNDHISANKKSFSCRWKDCPREQKPFKAQYMLVVHVRTHTGDKPNKCSFEGCNKRYSRLENLKTHLRSHTGEKPYACEFPGCNKAFSNASDRAKHQNRTHSNEKPYVCKVPGCTKRYTDPSSLRKHVKTVHGPEFYKNKRHKGLPDDGGGTSYGSPGDDTKLASVSSPSVKSEDAGSPGMPARSPGDGGGGGGSGGGGGGGGGGQGPAPEQPISDNNVSTTNGVSVVEAPWEIPEDEEVEVPMGPMAVQAGVGGGGGPANRLHPPPGRMYRPRLQAKNAMSHPALLQNGGRGPTLMDINYRLQHMRVSPSGGPVGCVPRRHSYDSAPRPDLGCGAPLDGGATTLLEPRRDSGATVSTYYGSWSSQQPSRRESQMSQMSAACGAAGGSLYDPISTDVSRRCSDMSAASAAPGRLSAGMAAQLQRLQRRSLVSQQMGSMGNLIVQSQSQCQAMEQRGLPGRPPCPSAGAEQQRRASDPVRPMGRPPRPLGPPAGPPRRRASARRHPNQEVVLDELSEDQYIEERLVLPDEMVNYLQQANAASNGATQAGQAAMNANQMSPHPHAQPSPAYSNQPVNSPAYSNQPVNSPAYSNQPVNSPAYSNQTVNSPAYSNQPVTSPAYSNQPVNSPFAGPLGSPAYQQPQQQPAVVQAAYGPQQQQQQQQQPPVTSPAYNQQSVASPAVAATAPVCQQVQQQAQMSCQMPAMHGCQTMHQQQVVQQQVVQQQAAQQQAAQQQAAQQQAAQQVAQQQAAQQQAAQVAQQQAVQQQAMQQAQQVQQQVQQQRQQQQMQQQQQHQMQQQQHQMQQQQQMSGGAMAQGMMQWHQGAAGAHNCAPGYHCPPAFPQQQQPQQPQPQPQQQPQQQQGYPAQQQVPPSVTHPCGGGAVHACGHPAPPNQPPLTYQQPCAACQQQARQQWAAGGYPGYGACQQQQQQQQQQQRSQQARPKPEPGRTYMNPDSYHRTLEYVQRCKRWNGDAPAPAAAAAPPTPMPFSGAASEVSVMDSASNVVPRNNMIINDMSSAMTALARENRYLHM